MKERATENEGKSHLKWRKEPLKMKGRAAKNERKSLKK